MIPMLSIIVFLPFIGGIAALTASRRPAVSRWIALAASVTNLLLVISLFGLLTEPGRTAGPWMLIEDLPWIEGLGIHYQLGLDGISLLLILLTTLLGTVSVLSSWRQIDYRVGLFHFFLLSIQSAILGVFLALDLFLFYLFWEVQLIPMFFLIGIWGHENRSHAAFKFFLFTISGGLIMLLSLAGLYLIHGHETGLYTLSFFDLMRTPMTFSAQSWLFTGFFLAFAVKIPLVPLHNWLPDAHTEAPTAGSIILAGLLLKTGAYALLRFAFPLFPAAAKSSSSLLIILGLAGFFYAAWIAFKQSDIKRLVAYSSIAHMGIIILGVAVWNIITLSGAVLQMINHGLSTGALFMLIGMLDERTGSRNFSDLGGLWTRMPVLSAFFLLFALSSLGLPGLNNFVGELLILLGTFIHDPIPAVAGFAGLIFTVVYLLRLIQGVLFGKRKKEYAAWDATPREVLILGILTLAVLFIGLHPDPILNLLEAPLQNILMQAK